MYISSVNPTDFHGKPLLSLSKYEEAKIYPGSAGNTINNLLALGAYVYPLGFIGKDSTGNKLMDYFSQFRNVDTSGIIRYDGSTVTKTRILAGDSTHIKATGHTNRQGRQQTIQTV